MTYRIAGLDPTLFENLYGLSDVELEKHNVVRMTVTDKPGFPCRVSLTDRDIGDTVLLINHVSQDADTPYRASHAIFVAEGADAAADFVDEVPPVFATRVLSLRGFDSGGMMINAILAQPGDADEGIRRLFDDPEVATIHAHNATRGCFAAKIQRN